jgi:hypothetical protein
LNGPEKSKWIVRKAATGMTILVIVIVALPIGLERVKEISQLSAFFFKEATRRLVTAR